MKIYKITISNNWYSPDRIELILSNEPLCKDNINLKNGGLIELENEWEYGNLEFVSKVETCKIIKNPWSPEEDEEMNCIINNLT
jgi:hypothetical protein